MKISAILLSALIAGSLQVGAQNGAKKQVSVSTQVEPVKPAGDKAPAQKPTSKKSKKDTLKNHKISANYCGPCGMG